MNTGFFKRFEGCRLGLCKAGFDSAFGENPAAIASLDEEELETPIADAVTNGGNLLAFRRLSMC